MNDSVVAKNKVVSFTYLILDQNGDLFEQSDLPLEYIHGCENEMFEKVEQSLDGKKIGETIKVQLSPEEGFGHKDSKLIFTDDIENAPLDLRHVGAKPTFQNGDGDIVEMTVIDVDNDKITIDGNHPLSGQTVTFSISIIGIRNASKQEITQGLQRGPSSDMLQ